MEYPKVLIFGHTFNDCTGMGVTLTNLFADWPSDKLCIFADNIDVTLCDKIRPCAQYIGCLNSKQSTNVNRRPYNSKKSKLKSLLRKLGLHELLVSWRYNKQAYAEARDFKPDIVFCALGSFAAMMKCQILLKEIGCAKLVLYIVDDWVNTRCRERYFSFIWNKLYDRTFRYLINKASGLLSICDYMSSEYLKLYGKKFYPFHNPVDIKKYNAIQAEPKYDSLTTSIVYLGKINDDTRPCLKDLQCVIHQLNEEGFKYVFDVYTPDHVLNKDLFQNDPNSNIFPPIPHDKVLRTIKSYSSLFLPLGFSKTTRNYVRLSMPTKLSEYLGSGKPIVLYCPPDIALSMYLQSKQAAFICNQNDAKELREKLLMLRSAKACSEVTENCSKLVLEHDITCVRRRFENTIKGFLYESYK